MDSIKITASQQFEIERFSRVIDATEDVPALRSIAKSLLSAWMIQRSATIWAFGQSLPGHPGDHE
jgi:hypothetical protein